MKLFIGPMSQNVVDAVIEFNNENPGSDLQGFIPSRRQIETRHQGGGYVCGWTTEKFVNYVGPGLIIKRDHGGPLQGAKPDDGMQSLLADLDAGVRFIHLDPWKKYPDIKDAARCTIDLFLFCREVSPTCLFEVGTEEGIRKYTPEELETFLSYVMDGIGPGSAFIRYAVVQSGTNVRGMANTGDFDKQRSAAMAKVCHDRGLLAKEHNSDYLTVSALRARAKCGVDAFNIAPEFGTLETSILMELLTEADCYDELNAFICQCVRSGKWERWVSLDLDFSHKKVDYLTRVCGHYNFETDAFRNARDALKRKGVDYDRAVKDEVKSRVKEIVEG